ncbi:MAG: class C sortase, partial [Oscillospiraceae bacterium]|nr:class C sortase [Oscillospiraceae bacterium]
MQGKKSTIILLVCFFIGLSVLLYPSLSSYWNSKTQTQAIVDYEGMLARIEAEDYTEFFAAAEQYNARLAALEDPFIDYDTLAGYNDILNLSGTGMMGYVTVPKINQELPLYHGTADSVLAFAAGHMEGTSFPVGGANTHSVVSAHRGLPTAVLFTYLDRMEIGDTFTFKILDR